MIISWNIVLPLGIFFARFGKRLTGGIWIKIHLALQLSSITASLVGLSFAFAMVPTGKHFKTQWHAQYGIILTLLALLQALYGLFRPPPPDPDSPTISGERYVFEYFHTWFGRLLLVASLIQVFGGMSLLHISAGWMFLYAVAVVGVFLVGFLVLEFRQRYDLRDSAADWIEAHLPGKVGAALAECIGGNVQEQVQKA